MTAPRAHLTGREYLVVVRGHRRAPAPPFTWDVRGLTPDEYDEVLLATGRIAQMAAVADTTPLLRLVPWSTT